MLLEISQSLKDNDIVNTLERLHVFYGIKSQRIEVDNGSVKDSNECKVKYKWTKGL